MSQNQGIDEIINIYLFCFQCCKCKCIHTSRQKGAASGPRYRIQITRDYNN